MFGARRVEFEAARVVAVGDKRSRCGIPDTSGVRIAGALAEVGVQFGVGAGERERDLRAQLAAVAAVQLMLDRRELDDGWAVLLDPPLAALRGRERGQRVLVLGGLGLPCADGGSVARDGLLDRGTVAAVGEGKRGRVLSEPFVCASELLACGGDLRLVPVVAVVGLGGAGCEQFAQSVAACAQLVAGGGGDGLGRSGGAAVERERLGGAAPERLADALQRVAVGELEAVRVGGGEVEVRGDAVARGGAVGPLAAVTVLAAEDANAVDARRTS